MSRPEDYHVNNGMNVRDALALAEKLGCQVHLDGGEVVVAHDLLREKVRTKVAQRRKDASRQFTGFLRRLVKLLGFAV